MEKTKRILIVEDIPTDADLAEREISKVIKECEYRRVETREDYLHALHEFKPDLIVSDYIMPEFDGMTALKIALDKVPATPFIMNTGSMNEDTAVDCMKAGATDYVIKEHIKRLGPAVLRAFELAGLKSENLKSQQALVESEARFRRLAENAGDLIYRYEIFPKRGFSYVSPSSTEITGYTPEEHYEDPGLGMKVIHPDDREYMEKTGTNINDAGKPVTFRWIRKDGEMIWIEQRNVPVTDDSGNIIALEGIARDVTGRMVAGESLKKALEKAEHSDKLKTAFLNNLSHEIRTPLNAIVGFTAFLGEPDLPAERTRYIADIIQQSSDQLLAVIEDIINLSTIQTGQVDIHESETDIAKTVTGICERFACKAEMKGVEIEKIVKLDHDESLVMTDEGKLSHVLTHLIDNALKFTDYGKVTVSCGRVNNSIKISVSDTGIGIDPSLGEIIFDRFHQVETELAKMRGGLGLGLPVSKSFVEAMGGKLWYEHGDSQGTIFNLEFPWKPLQQDNAGNTGTNFVKSEGKKLLVAEDEESNFLLIEEVLSGSGISLLHAWNGKQAVELVDKNLDIDLVLMDVKMPLMGGYEATSHIKKKRPDLPVIAITAHALSGDREKALGAGCDEYLTKPVSVRSLVDIVNKYLGVQ